ncbi:hypothetical protein AXF74_08605 [Campylobacter coli]|nr:hypothetical protein [Campylobacter coli]
MFFVTASSLIDIISDLLVFCFSSNVFLFVIYCNFTKKTFFCKAYIVLLNNTKIILYNFVILKNTKNYKRIPNNKARDKKILKLLKGDEK